MKKIFVRDFWNLENLKERCRRLREAFGTAFHEIVKPANGKLDRKYKLALSLTGVVLLAVVSWIAGSKIQSPAEAAARTAPPSPSPILVPVEERVLSSDVITRGTGALWVATIHFPGTFRLEGRSRNHHNSSEARRSTSGRRGLAHCLRSPGLPPAGRYSGLP